MKRYLFKATIFLGLLAVGLGALEWLVAERISEPTERQYDAIFRSPEQLDNVVFGTSHAENGIHPFYLESRAFSLYNLGIAGSTPTYHRHLYNMLRQRSKPPRFVLYSVDWFLFDSTLKRSLETDSEFLPFEQFLGYLGTPGMRRDVMLANRFALIKQRNNVQNYLVFRKRTPTMPELYYKGWISSSVAPAKLRDRHSYRQPSEVSKRTFRELVHSMRRDGVRLVFVQTPEYLPASRLSVRENAFIAEVARELDVPFLNYNGPLRSSLNEDRSNFLDWGHMSVQGSRRFSKVLKQELRRLALDL